MTLEFISLFRTYLYRFLSSWGHYLVVFWNGYWNKVGDLNSPLKYSVNRSQNRWDGSAIIPLDYLPPKVELVFTYTFCLHFTILLYIKLIGVRNECAF